MNYLSNCIIKTTVIFIAKILESLWQQSSQTKTQIDFCMFKLILSRICTLKMKLEVIFKIFYTFEKLSSVENRLLYSSLQLMKNIIYNAAGYNLRL